MSFYQVPKFVFDPIGRSGVCHGNILLPADFTGGLKKQVEKYGYDGVTSNENPDNLEDPEWWEAQRDSFDWIVAITQGLGDKTNWILEYGLDVTRHGVVVLDRLTLLEPTRKREGFLKESNLVNLKILSPRPSFRADNKQLKDSVTSAWFVFYPIGAAPTNTTIEYEVGWQQPKILSP